MLVRGIRGDSLAGEFRGTPDKADKLKKLRGFFTSKDEIYT
jgi:hypothetical protein